MIVTNQGFFFLSWQPIRWGTHTTFPALTWYRGVFPRLGSSNMFSGYGCIFPALRTGDRWQNFPRASSCFCLVTYFPALTRTCLSCRFIHMFSLNQYQLSGTSCMVSRAWHHLQSCTTQQLLVEVCCKFCRLFRVAFPCYSKLYLCFHKTRLHTMLPEIKLIC